VVGAAVDARLGEREGTGRPRPPRARSPSAGAAARRRGGAGVAGRGDIGDAYGVKAVLGDQPCGLPHDLQRRPPPGATAREGARGTAVASTPAPAPGPSPAPTLPPAPGSGEAVVPSSQPASTFPASAIRVSSATVKRRLPRSERDSLDGSITIRRVSPLYVTRSTAGKAVYALHGEPVATSRPGQPAVDAAFVLWHGRQVFKRPGAVTTEVGRG
jgi:hypothetical protein